MPSFAIEAPGEVNPLSEQTLLHTLQAASSSQPNQIQSGTKQLQQWERSEGFYKHLQSVYITHSLPVEVRYLAIIQLKNGIDKYWRKTATNAVSKDDKAIIRSRLISSAVDETDHRLALQNSLVIAKIVRYEYPQEWPDAIAATLNAIRSAAQDSTTHRLERTLLVLLYIIKELSTAKIQRSRTNLQAATPEILAVLGSLYISRVDHWQNAPPGSDETERSMTQSLLCIKTLRRLVISGYDHPNRVPEVCEFWQITLRQLETFMGLVHHSTAPIDNRVQRSVQKHLLQLSKFHHEMADKHPAGFALLPSSLDLVRAYWSFTRTDAESYASHSTSVIDTNGDEDADSDTSTSEKVSLRGLLLIRACVRMAFMPVHTFRYRQEDEKQEKRQAEATIKGDLLTQTFVEEIASTVMTKFLVLRQSDLRDSQDEPEEWVFREENETADLQLSVRACSERVVLDLSTHFKATLTEPILGLFRTVADVDYQDVLLKDAVYAAIGLAAAIFRDDVDFDTLLASTLVSEIQKQTQGCNIIRRRIAIFCGQWMVIKASQDSKAIIYQIYNHLLDPDDQFNDSVVRITAGRHFKYIADDFDFDWEQFAPYAESIIMRLMALIEEVSLTATKMALLDTISVLIDRFEHHIEPFAERIIAILPALWEQSGDEHMMKQSILVILARLTNALKEQSSRFHAMLIPIIRSTVQPDNELSAFLLEEALELWQSILTQTRDPTEDLLSLIPHLFPLLGLASETLRETLTILESYLYLSPSTMLSEDLRLPLLNAIAPHLGPHSKQEANGLACINLELMIRSSFSLGGVPFVKQLTSDLLTTSILPQLLAGLHSAWSAHCTTGPNAATPAVDGPVETDYLALLARLILADLDASMHALSAAGPGAADPLPWLLEEWFSHLDSVGDPARKKLFLLALTALLDTGHPAALGNLQLLMGLWTDVVSELCEVDLDPVTGEGSGAVRGEDSLVYADASQLGQVGEGTVEAPEDKRKRDAFLADEVHRVGVVGWVRAKLGAVVVRVGEEVFREEWLGRVDGEVVKAFGRLGIM